MLPESIHQQSINKRETDRSENKTKLKIKVGNKNQLKAIHSDAGCDERNNNHCYYYCYYYEDDGCCAA